MGVSWRELVTALWRATTVDWRTSLHEEKGGRGIGRKSRRVVSSSYLVIPHMHTSIHTYMHIISYLLAHTYYTHFSSPTKPTPQLPHTRVEKSGNKANTSFPLPLSFEPSHLITQDGESVAVFLVLSVSLRMSHIKMTFDTRDLLPETSVFF